MSQASVTRRISITQEYLEAALLQWEAESRSGATRSHEEADALPIEQVAKESAAHLFAILISKSARA